MCMVPIIAWLMARKRNKVDCRGLWDSSMCNFIPFDHCSTLGVVQKVKMMMTISSRGLRKRQMTETLAEFQRTNLIVTLLAVP